MRVDWCRLTNHLNYLETDDASLDSLSAPEQHTSDISILSEKTSQYDFLLPDARQVSRLQENLVRDWDLEE